MRLFCATLAHESSSFSPLPTSLENFREGLLHRPSRGEIVQERLAALEGGLAAKAMKRGHEVIESVAAAATPSGPLVRTDYESLRDEIVSDLKRAMPVDAIALFLHGAQLAQGYDDCEGDLLAALRAIVGPGIPVGVEIDLHGNVTEAMIRNATVIIACKEYPHTDFPERADEVLNILEMTVEGRVKPVTAFRKLPMLGIFHTTRQPMRGFVDRLSALEKEQRVLSVSVAHGFPWADTPHAGSAVFVSTNGDEALARSVCDRLAGEFFALREEIATPRTTVSEALAQFQAHPSGLTLIADTADNAGGGAASDSTYLLHEIARRAIPSAAIGMIWDPIAVQFAFGAGIDTRFPLRIGGKTSALSGEPFDAEVTVTALNRDLHQFAFGTRQRLGAAAAVRYREIDIVLSSAREQTHSPECFMEMGIDLKAKRLVVLKSAQHFYARFKSLTSQIIYAVAPGATSVDFATFPYTRIRRPIWPLDPDVKFDLRAEG